MNMANDTVLMKISVSVGSVKAWMIHRFTNLPLAELNIQNTQIEFVQK